MLSFEWPMMAVLLPLPWLINKLFKQPVPELHHHKVYLPRLEKLQLAMAAAAPNTAIKKSVKYGWQLVWLLLILTVMRPQIVQQPEFANENGYDMMLAVDLSKSMAALDFAKGSTRITRLHAVQDVINKFVQQRQGDRLGLIVFAEAAYSYVPLTFDINSVSQQLQQLAVGMAGDSTAIGDAIGLAIKNLQHRQGERILILLTDGADNASRVPPLQAAKLAAKHKIKIYTIGVGSNGMVPIRDDDGNLVMFEGILDEKLLKQIAKITGGIYSQATNKTALENIYTQINTLEQQSGVSKVIMIRTTLHYIPLGAALLVLLVLLLLHRRNLYVA